mmetsp:Transcript_16609/g.31589  ORF Transcript_16609/g.31589 Transcript_16609/m.31589 type:complete len:175 (-) Transcript_16609:155-679(-)
MKMPCKCACCLYKDNIIITAQVLSVLVFGIDIWGWEEIWIPGLVALLILLFGACCDIQKVGFYAALVISVIAALAFMFGMIFVEERYMENNDCQNDDGSIEDDWYCEESNLYILFAVGILLHLTVAGLIGYFLTSERFTNCQEENRRQSVHPANSSDDAADENVEEAAENKPKE